MSDNPLLPVLYEGPGSDRGPRKSRGRRPGQVGGLPSCCQPLPPRAMEKIVELDEQRRKLLGEDPALPVLLAEIELAVARDSKVRRRLNETGIW